LSWKLVELLALSSTIHQHGTATWSAKAAVLSKDRGCLVSLAVSMYYVLTLMVLNNNPAIDTAYADYKSGGTSAM
jgi:hypothetical protein